MFLYLRERYSRPKHKRQPNSCVMGWTNKTPTRLLQQGALNQYLNPPKAVREVVNETERLLTPNSEQSSASFNFLPAIFK